LDSDVADRKEEIHLRDHNADVRDIDDVTRARRASPNRDSAAHLHVDAGGSCADCCRSRRVGTEIVALHERVVPIV